MSKLLYRVPALVLAALLFLGVTQGAQAGRLGVDLQNVPNNGGARIVNVQPASPAADLNLRPGFIIVAVGGMPVTGAIQVRDYVANPTLATIQMVYVDPALPAGANTFLVTADVLVVAAATGRTPMAGATTPALRIRPGTVTTRRIGGTTPRPMPTPNRDPRRFPFDPRRN